MAVPVNPKAPWATVSFYQLAIDVITICSNLALPDHGDDSVTTALSGATATAIVNILTRQRDLY